MKKKEKKNVKIRKKLNKKMKNKRYYVGSLQSSNDCYFRGKSDKRTPFGHHFRNGRHLIIARGRIKNRKNIIVDMYTL